MTKKEMLEQLSKRKERDPEDSRCPGIRDFQALLFGIYPKARV